MIKGIRPNQSVIYHEGPFFKDHQIQIKYIN